MFEHIEQKTIKLTDEQQQELIKLACDERKLWEDQTQDLRAKALESRQLYFENRPESKLAKAENDGLANVRRPVLAQALDSVQAQQQQSMFPSEERFFGLKPLNKEGRENKSDYEESIENRITENNIMLGIYKDQFNNKIDFASAAYHPFKRITQEKMVYKYPEIMGVPVKWMKPQSSKQEVVVAEYTDFVPISPFDWWIDPCVDKLEDTAFIWRYWMTKEDLKSTKYLLNTDKITTYNERSLTDVSSTDKEMSYRYFGVDRSEEKMGAHYVCVYERWGDFYIGDKLYENYYLIYSNDSVFHYFGPNPYNHGMKPFTVCPWVPVSGSLLGKSLAQDIIPLAHTSDTMLNQVLDTMAINVNSWFTYLMNDPGIRETIAKEGRIVLLPGQGIPVQSHDAIQARQWDLSGLNFLLPMMQSIKDEIRESTGGLSYATGGIADSDPTRTATESSLLASGASTRYQSLNQFYEDMKLKPYIKMFIENDKQFLSEPLLVDEEFISPNTVKFMEYVVDILGSKSVLTRDLEAQRHIEFLPVLEKMVGSGFISVRQDKTAEFDVIEYVKQIMKTQKINDDLLNEQELTSEEMPQLGDVLNETGTIPPAGQNPAEALMGAVNGMPGMGGVNPAIAGPEGPIA